jgi:hypothetical protein
MQESTELIRINVNREKQIKELRETDANQNENEIAELQNW